MKVTKEDVEVAERALNVFSVKHVSYGAFRDLINRMKADLEPHEYKVGDRVKVIKESGGLWVGDQVDIDRIGEHGVFTSGGRYLYLNAIEPIPKEYTDDDMHPPTPQGMHTKDKKRIEAMVRALAYKGDHKQIVKDAVNIIKQINEL